MTSMSIKSYINDHFEKYIISIVKFTFIAKVIYLIKHTLPHSNKEYWSSNVQVTSENARATLYSFVCIARVSMKQYNLYRV